VKPVSIFVKEPYTTDSKCGRMLKVSLLLGP